MSTRKSFIVCLATILLLVSLQSISFASTDLHAQYVGELISYIEETPVTADSVIDLRDISSKQIIAACYTLSTGGYAIIDLQINMVYEYSLDTASPYHGVSTACYYAGPNNYFTEESPGLFVHTKNISIAVDAVSIARSMSDFSSYRASRSNIKSLREKLADLEDARQNPMRPSETGSLTSSLSTLWVNDYCGPTSMHCLLKYQGKLRSPNTGTTDEIYLIAGYTGQYVNLDTLVSGTKAYLKAYGISGTVYSSSYNYSTIKSRIDANKPITLGTNGGGLVSGGHVQTIHKYSRLFLGGDDIYTLYVNDSWGSNNITITYEWTPPSYLKDHVYVT